MSGANGPRGLPGRECPTFVNPKPMSDMLNLQHGAYYTISTRAPGCRVARTTSRKQLARPHRAMRRVHSIRTERNLTVLNKSTDARLRSAVGGG